MERICRDVERQLARFDGHGAMPRIVAAWPAAVGEEVTRNAWPARVARDGTLHVHTSSSVWAFELGQLAPAILERLRAELGDAAPKALRFAQGHLPEPAIATPETTPARAVSPSPDALAAAARLAAGIEDQDLRKEVEKAVSLGLSSGADDRSL
jgi:predicted nucleic acid-binding Zn ribbon protein